MKKAIITILYVVTTCTAIAQTTVTSKALGDQIKLQKSAFEITPIILNGKGDTARSLSWFTSSLFRDTTVVLDLSVTLYDKTGNVLSTESQLMPGSIYTKWLGLVNKIDAYILNQRKRFVKQ